VWLKFCRASDKARLRADSAAESCPRDRASRDLLLARCKRRAALSASASPVSARRAFLFGIATRTLPFAANASKRFSPIRARASGTRRADRGVCRPDICDRELFRADCCASAASAKGDIGKCCRFRSWRNLRINAISAAGLYRLIILTRISAISPDFGCDDRASGPFT